MIKPDYIALGALIVSVLGFLVLVVKSTSNKDLIMSIKDSNKEMIESLKDAINELRNAIIASTERQKDNFFDFKEHQGQGQRTHDAVNKIDLEVRNLSIEVGTMHTELDNVKKDIAEIKNNTIHCKKVTFNN